MSTSIRLRPFLETDYGRMVEVANQIYPAAPRSLDDVRQRDEHWNRSRFELLRLVAADGSGNVVGWGQLNHLPHQFDAHGYRIGIQVVPDYQRQGIGTRMFAALIQELRAREATTVSARARADMTASVEFLRHRGFVPVEETFESTLRVNTFDPARSVEAESRLAGEGIAFTSLAIEGARNHAVLENVHALYLACLQDVPTANPVTNISFEHFVNREINAPNALPEAYFLAVAGGSYVAMCDFVRDPGLPQVLSGRMSGCLPAWRGKGIVTALKLRLAKFALDSGFGEIRTWNSASNVSMLRINESIGFVKRSAWVTFHRDVASDADEGTKRA